MKKSTKSLLSVIGLGALGAHASMSVMAKEIFKKTFQVDQSYMEKDLVSFLPTDELQEKYLKQIDEQIAWFKASNKEHLTIKSFDGFNLDGVLLKIHDNHNYLILVHGYNTDRYILLKQAFEFAKRGLNILLIDQRAYGESEGTYTTFGFKEHIDLLQWVDKLVELDDDAKIGLYGVSMGASTVMMTLGATKNEHITFAIEDAGYSELKDELAFMLQDKLTSLTNVAMSYLERHVRKTLGFDISEVSPIKALENNNIPICFIHAKNDALVPYEMAKALYHANRGKKVFYPIEDGSHAYTCYLDDYFDNLDSFVKQFVD